MPRSEKEACDDELVGPSVDVRNVFVDTIASEDGTARALCKDDGNGSEMIIHESLRTNRTEAVGSVVNDGKETSNGIAEVGNVPENLLGIERILMDETDDLGHLQQPDKDGNFDLFNDFSSLMDTQLFHSESVPVERNEIGELPSEGNMKGDVAGETKGKVEGNRSKFGGDVVKSCAHISVEREISDCLEVENQNVGKPHVNGGRKETKLCKDKVSQDVSNVAGISFTAQQSVNEEMAVPIGNFVGPLEKRHKSGSTVKGKTKKGKKEVSKDVKSSKNKHISVDGAASDCTNTASADPVFLGKMPKQNAYGNKGNLSATKLGRPSQKSFLYTREQLLHIRETATVPEAVQEIAAHLHEGQNNAGGKENVSGILKTKKRGSSSEARKEKKKQKKRKKRAEMNKKLGVKRLKLKPVLKPKVVPHCRHYLIGRCQQGENCKFSHDVIPVTKSKPCCFFAKQSCMKGDDCPFDHNLSKYPCNNFATTGFCARGDSCLFSHKIPAKENSEVTAGGSNCESSSKDQLDKSKTKQQINDNVSSSSGITTPKNPEKHLVIATSQPAKAPRGLSFLTVGKSPVDDSAKQSFLTVGKSPVDDSAKHKAALSTQQIGDTAGTSGQSNQALQERASVTSKGISAPSIAESSSFANYGNKLQANLATNHHASSLICNREKRSTNESDNLKAVQPEIRSSSTGQCSIVVGGPAKVTPTRAQNALLSTLAFAAKYESGIKMGPMSGNKEVNKDEGTSSGSGSRKNEPMNPSAILEFLYSKSDKGKQ